MNRKMWIVVSLVFLCAFAAYSAAAAPIGDSFLARPYWYHATYDGTMLLTGTVDVITTDGAAQSFELPATVGGFKSFLEVRAAMTCPKIVALNDTNVSYALCASPSLGSCLKIVERRTRAGDTIVTIKQVNERKCN